MKATLRQEDVNKGLATVSRTVATKGQLPILANVLIDATKEGVALVATNLETGLVVRIGGKVTEEGKITVPAKNLSEFVNTLPQGPVEWEESGTKLSVKAGRFAATFAGIDASEFPVVPRLTEGERVTIKGGLVEEIASRVAYAAATDESRPVLTGVKLATDDNQLIVTATDGFRLSRMVMGAGYPASSEIKSLILPARTIFELARMVAENGGEVEMEVRTESNQVIFGVGKAELVSRILEGNFPEVEKIIPTDFKTTATLDREELTKAVRAVAVFARESNNIVKMILSFGKMVVKAAGGQSGESEVEVEAEVAGEGGEIAFNFRYLMDFLGSTKEERVVFKMNGSLTPGLWTDDKPSGLIHVIMPVRI